MPNAANTFMQNALEISRKVPLKLVGEWKSNVYKFHVWLIVIVKHRNMNHLV